MTSLEFVRNKLEGLVISFPNLKCSYTFDEQTDDHLVEIKPTEIYKKSKESTEILTTEMEILSEFIDNYPHESLIFLDENDILKVESPSFVIIGDRYVDSSLISDFKNISISLPNQQDSLFSYPVKLESVVISPVEIESAMAA